jgi:tRNA-modifying protein YgfZ
MQKIIYLKNNGFLKVTGKDAATFLQGQLTCDVTKVTQKTSVLGACCDPSGRVQAFFRLFQLADGYYLRLPKTLVPILLAHLSKYAIFSAVALSNASDTLRMTGVMTEGAPPNYVNDGTQHCVKIADNRYEYYSPNLVDASDDSSVWALDNMKAGIPEIHPETAGKFLPHPLNLVTIGAIDFEKGCYVGQEIIARMHYRGKLKQHLYLAMAEKTTSVSLNQGLCDQQQPETVVGYVVDHVLAGSQQYLLVTLFDRAAKQPLIIKEQPNDCLKIVSSFG